MIRNWIKVNVLSGQYSINKNINFKTSILGSDICAYSDEYIVVKGRITVREMNRDEMNDAASNKIINNETITSKSFEYKTKIIGRTPADNNTLDLEVVVTLKYLSNLWRFLNFLFINCKIELYLSWSKEFIMSEISITPGATPDRSVTAIQTTGATFQINNANLYVPVVFCLSMIISNF